MPSRPTGQQEGEFNALLPSKPIAPPFGGNYEKVRFIYNLDRVMSLPTRRSRLLQAEIEEMDALTQEQLRRIRELEEQRAPFVTKRDAYLNRDLRARADAALELLRDEQVTPEALADAGHLLLAPFPGEKPTDAEESAFTAMWRQYDRSSAEQAEKIMELDRRMSLKVIGYVIDQLIWPFTSPAPDPRDPDSWESFSDTVLGWIVSAEGGLKLAQEQMRSPLSVVK